MVVMEGSVLVYVEPDFLKLIDSLILFIFQYGGWPYYGGYGG
jgi:hypothetical protein